MCDSVLCPQSSTTATGADQAQGHLTYTPSQLTTAKPLSLDRERGPGGETPSQEEAVGAAGQTPASASQGHMARWGVLWLFFILLSVQMKFGRRTHAGALLPPFPLLGLSRLPDWGLSELLAIRGPAVEALSLKGHAGEG